MHKLIDYICDELDEIERKADKGKLSMQEIQYADTLAHMKKNLLKADEMMGEEYSEADGRGRGRNAKRDNRGRYASEGRSYNRYNPRMGGSYADGMDEVVESIYSIMDDLPDNMKADAKRFVQKLEQM